MAELTEDHKYQRDIAQALRIIDDHNKDLEQKRFDAADKRPLHVIKREILSRITETVKSIKYRATTKAIYFYEMPDGEYIIKDRIGKKIGIYRPDRGLRKTIILAKDAQGNATYPIFELSKENGNYFKVDLKTDEKSTDLINKNEIDMLYQTASNDEMLAVSKVVFEKINNKEYSFIDRYILDSMETIIYADNSDSSLRDMMGVYTQLQVLIRQIESKKVEVVELNKKGEINASLLTELDVLYRQVCQILLNNKLYKLPDLNESRITNL